MNLLQVTGVGHRYSADFTVLHDISFALNSGEAVALLGRSGCGKSTLARMLVGLEKPDFGEISWQSKPVSSLRGDALRAFRREVQMVFQDPVSAVNPRKTVSEILREPLRYLVRCSVASQNMRIKAILQDVELDITVLDKHPSQLSGGQLQRICLARAMLVEPALLILDESVSSLDLRLQAGIMALLRRLQTQSGAACLFITHDLRLINDFCQRVMVMEHGQIVETAPVSHPLHFHSTAGKALQRAVLPAFPQSLMLAKRPCIA